MMKLVSFVAYLKLLVVLICSSFIACQLTTTHNEVNVNQNFNQNSAVELLKNIRQNSQVKWIYVEEPIDFGSPGDETGSSKVSVFYLNGEFGRMWVGLKKSDNKKTKLTAYFDEIVEFGKWSDDKGQVKIDIQKCRCLHCNEDHPSNLDKSDLRNAVPFVEIWNTKNGKLGDDENNIIRGNRKYRLINKNEFIYENYEAMTAEPLKVKDDNSDNVCLAYDLKEF